MTMMRRAGVVVVATAAMLAVVIGPATAGSSHSRYISDPKRDVAYHKSQFTAKQKAATDLTRVHYWTTAHKVKVRFTLRKLGRHVRKPELLLMSGNAAGGMELAWDPGARPYVQKEGVKSCNKHSTQRTSYAHSYIQLSFPKRCFGTHLKYPQVWGESAMPKVVKGQTIYLIDNTKYGRFIYL